LFPGYFSSQLFQFNTHCPHHSTLDDFSNWNLRIIEAAHWVVSCHWEVYVWFVLYIGDMLNYSSQVCKASCSCYSWHPYRAVISNRCATKDVQVCRESFEEGQKEAREKIKG
jgi:hypothetical protein